MQKRKYKMCIYPKNLTGLAKFLISFLFSFKALHALQYGVMTLGPKKNNYMTSWGGLYGYKRETFPTDVFFPLTQVEFEGKLYNAPGCWDLFLRQIYGNYMQIPPEEQRHTHDAQLIRIGKEG
jgi:phosphorylcholine metabolism protein LicD